MRVHRGWAKNYQKSTQQAQGHLIEGGIKGETIWDADEAESPNPKPCKSIMISIWDPQKENTVRFDLWTKDMMHHEMNTFVFQSLLMIGETYSKSTGNVELAREIQNFAKNFGVKSKVLKANKEEEGIRKPFTFDL